MISVPRRCIAHRIGVITNMARVEGAQCPLCASSIPPDRVRTADGAAECAACRMTVLVRRVALSSREEPSSSAFPPPPQEWPATLPGRALRACPACRGFRAHRRRAAEGARSEPRRGPPTRGTGGERRRGRTRGRSLGAWRRDLCPRCGRWGGASPVAPPSASTTADEVRWAEPTLTLFEI